MTVRCLPAALLAALGLLWLAGCGNETGTLPPETDDPLYVQGKQLQRQDRNAEALVSFLKVIEKRGEGAAPEAHFEAGLIYLHHTKDFIEAIHHFQRYLELVPNSPQRDSVKELVNTAKREFARTLPARPIEDQSVRMENAEEIEQLRRDNAELRAEIATLRGGGLPATSSSRLQLTPGPAARAAPPPVAVNDSPLIPAARPASNGGSGMSSVPPSAPPVSRARAAPPTAPPAAGGKTYTVKAGEGLYAIARRADPANVNRKLQQILEANREQLTDGVNSKLKPGMVLRIP